MTVTRVSNSHTLVLFCVRLSCGAEQGNTKDVPRAGEPVLRFGKDCNTIAKLAQIRELDQISASDVNRSKRSYLVTTDFKFGKVPGGVLVSRTLNVAERGLIGGDIAVDIEGNLDFFLQSVPGLN